MKKKVRAVGLFSGGLDSILATKLMIDQGIEVTALLFTTPFSSPPKNTGDKHTIKIPGMKLKIKTIDLGPDYLQMVENPKFGYGKNMNPCIDCRILMLKKAKNYMKKIHASFIFTGEVLGQRPMSQQKNTLKLIEKEAGLEGLLLRPLSAHWLDRTIPEKEGWVDRQKLLDLKGRQRKPQLQLAKEFGIKKYQWPAGGCMLTDPEFSHRMKEALAHKETSRNNLTLLQYGRHFRLKSGAKVIVGRNRTENALLATLANKKDTLIEITGCGSPLTLLRKGKKHDIETAAAICARYSDCTGETAQAAIWNKNKPKRWHMTIQPLKDDTVQSLRVQKKMAAK